MLDPLLTGITNTFSWPNILIPVLGTMLAMITAFIPGVGSASVMAVALILTASWSPESVLLLFGALVGGATFMGSITAILFNIPGSAPNAAALLDGYPLNRKGYPKTAISCAATASAVGSLFGVIVLVLMIPVLRPFINTLGPPERFLLGCWGLSTVIAVPGGSKLKAGTMCLLGLLIAMLGSDPVSGQARWTFGSDWMIQGFGTIPVLLGFFTIAEIISWDLKKIGSGAEPLPVSSEDSVAEGVRSVFRHKWLTLRSSVIGTLVGIVPGVGGTVAGFVAYGQAAQGAGDNGTFGNGDIRGLIAPESAIDAKDGGSLLPAIAFGLPGSEAGVFLITVLLMHGLVPGTAMMSTQLALTFTLVIALLFSNLLTSVLGILLTKHLAGLRNIPLQYAALPVLALCLILLVQFSGSLFDLFTAIGFGIAGFMFKRLDWPRVPFIIAFVLGNFLERNLALTTRLLELERIQPLQRPASFVILLFILMSLFWMYRRSGDATAGGIEDRPVEVLLSLVICLFTLLLLAQSLLAPYSPVSIIISAGAALLSGILLIRSVTAY